MPSNIRVSDSVQHTRTGDVGVVLEEITTISAELKFFVIQWSSSAGVKLTANSEHELKTVASDFKQTENNETL